MYHHYRTPLFLALFTALSGCGGSSPAPTTPTDSPATEAEPAPTTGAEAPVPDKWHAELTNEQKAAYMKAKVVPPMEAVFKENDPVGYAQFGCVTCHGPEYKTPTAYLPRLTFKGGTFTSFEEDPDTSKFMAEKVLPAMVTALGAEPYNPETNKGFGCGGCHGIDMK
jgi:cytochrome c553